MFLDQLEMLIPGLRAPIYQIQTLQILISTAQEDITYYVSVSDVQGCSDQDSVIITVLSVPIASFTPEIEAGCEGVVVKFTNTSIDGF